MEIDWVHSGATISQLPLRLILLSDMTLILTIFREQFIPSY